MREDQAAGLRRLFAPQAARVLVVAWDAWPQRGWLAINLAAAFSRAGEQVLLLDPERESVTQLWGARVRYDLAQVIEGDRRLSQVLAPGPETSVIAPMRRAAAQLGRKVGPVQHALSAALGTTAEEGAILVVPLALRSLLSPLWRFPGGEQLICTGTGSAAVTAAYASIKALLAQRVAVRLALAPEAMTGNADPALEVRECFTHLADVARRFLGASIRFAGSLPTAELASGAPGLTLFDQSEGQAAAVEAIAASTGTWKLPRLGAAVRRPQGRPERALSA